MASGPIFHTALFSSSELLIQPWRSDLTRMINASYLVSHTNNIKFAADKKRLRSDSQLSEELGPDGFTAVAFAANGSDQPVEVIGTASMKKWIDDGLWRPYNEQDISKDRIEECVNEDVDRVLQQYACPGDYELAVVALPPDPRYRGKGIAAQLIRLCEEEVLRRQRISGGDCSSPVRLMIRVAKANNGAYWLKQGFTAVGSRRCPKGFWSAMEEFTMWAMVRELSSK